MQEWGPKEGSVNGGCSPVINFLRSWPRGDGGVTLFRSGVLVASGWKSRCQQVWFLRSPSPRLADGRLLPVSSAAFPLRTHPPGGSSSSYKDDSLTGLGPTFRPHLILVTSLKAPSTGIITTGFGLRHRLLGQTQFRPELPSEHSPRSWKDLCEHSSRPRSAGCSPGQSTLFQPWSRHDGNSYDTNTGTWRRGQQCCQRMVIAPSLCWQNNGPPKMSRPNPQNL